MSQQVEISKTHSRMNVYLADIFGFQARPASKPLHDPRCSASALQSSHLRRVQRSPGSWLEKLLGKRLQWRALNTLFSIFSHSFPTLPFAIVCPLRTRAAYPVTGANQQIWRLWLKKLNQINSVQFQKQKNIHERYIYISIMIKVQFVGIPKLPGSGLRRLNLQNSKRTRSRACKLNIKNSVDVGRCFWFMAEINLRTFTHHSRAH